MMRRLNRLLLVKKEKNGYVLSHDTKLILLQLKDHMYPKELTEESSKKIFINHIFTDLKIEQIHRLFVHTHLNIQNALLSENLNLDLHFTDKCFITLSDLFSLRLLFGRVHFPLDPCHVDH